MTALVIDADAGARRQVAGLLQLGGWQVQEAADPDEALRHSNRLDPDLVVTDVVLPGGTGPQLLNRLRRAGSCARFLVVTAEPTDQVRADCAAAGALACLPKPVDARLLLDLVRRRSSEPAQLPVTVDIVEVDDLHDTDLDAGLWERLREMYEDALPTRLTAITSSVRAGNPAAVAAAAHTLAGTSGQLGHPDVAGVCLAIAADARRGILAHHLVADLAELALGAEAAAGRVTAQQQLSRLARIYAARQ